MNATRFLTTLALALATLSGAMAQTEPSSAAGQDATALSLADVIVRVLEHNPTLAAFAWDIRAAEARRIQAALRPNPELAVEVEGIRVGSRPRNRATSRSLGLGFDDGAPSVEAGLSRESTESQGGAFGEAELTISLSQVVELGGKRARRLALADRDREAAAWDYEIARADALEEAAAAFVAALAAQERVGLERESVRLAEQVLETVAARVDAGRASPIEAHKSETALSVTRLAFDRSERDYASARTTLSALWGEVPATFEQVTGDLYAVRPIPDLEPLLAQIEKNPDVKRWSAEMEKRQAAIALERAKGKPDVTLDLGLRLSGAPDERSKGWSVGTDGILFGDSRSESRRDGDTSLVVGFSVPLPLFDRNQGSIQEAEHLAAKGAEESRATDVRLRAGLMESHQSLANAHDAVTTLREKVLPEAAATLAAVQEGYRQGKFGFLDVLDAQRTLFDAQNEYLDAVADYHRGVARMERLIGDPLWPDVMAPSAYKE